MLLDQVLMPPSAGMAEARCRHFACCALWLTQDRLALRRRDSRSAPVAIQSGAGVELEQECGAGGKYGAGGISRAQWRFHAVVCADTVHPLNESDGSLTLQNLALTASVKRALANDVTVCGENEPVVFVTEYFLGDGANNVFDLAADPYCPTASEVDNHQRALQ